MTDTSTFDDLTPPVTNQPLPNETFLDWRHRTAKESTRWGARRGWEQARQLWPEPDDDSDEVWRPIAGYEMLYSVSSHGRIRSETRYIETPKGSRIVYEKILKQTPARNDYMRVTLAKDGDHKTALTHQLVARAFLGPRPGGMHVLHGPLGRQCNLVSNLYYGTPSQNHGPDRIRDGTDIRGTKHGNSVLTDDDVRAIRASGETQEALAKRYGVGRTTIRHVQARESWAWLDSEPRQPSLQEQALALLDPELDGQPLTRKDADLIRRALEQAGEGVQ